MSHDVRLRPSSWGPLVLVVDEELTRRSILSRMIRAFGYSVQNCATSREALQFLREHPREVRLLIADLMLPGMDGGELVERGLDLDPTIRVLLTVDTDNPDAVELHAGYHDFAWVRKPITFSALANRLDELFARRPVPSYASPMGPPARTWRRSGQFQA
jgi:two-component system, cell cycle sensor histidine kinase and response regulator CckA